MDSCSPEYIGGNSYFTAGGFRTVHHGLKDVVPLVTNVSPDKVVQIDITPYSEAEFTGDIMRMSASQSDPGVVEALVSNSRGTVQWLRDYVGVRFVLSFHRQAFLVDGVQKFWGGMVLATEDGGKGLMVDHMRKADEEGIHFWHSCRATELIVEEGTKNLSIINAFSGSVAKVTWIDDTFSRRPSSSMPASSVNRASRPSVPGATISRGPVAGVNGTAHCSFG